MFTGAISSDSNSSPDANISTLYSYITGGIVTVYGKEGANLSLVIDSASTRSWRVDIGIEMKECPPGLGLFNNTCTCHVANPCGSVVLCLGPIKCMSTDVDNGAYLKQGYWMGHLGNSSELYVTLCLPGYCNGNTSSLAGMFCCHVLPVNWRV